VGDKIHFYAPGLWSFHCPACGYEHGVHVNGTKNSRGATWGWNGSTTAPSFTPSILINKDAYSPRCHSYVTDGKIQYLSDCTHGMAGQKVELPDWDAEAIPAAPGAE
jgi:hypothetical protein